MVVFVVKRYARPKNGGTQYARPKNGGTQYARPKKGGRQYASGCHPYA